MQDNPHPLLRVALQSVRDAVVTTDALGRITAWNAAAEALTGWRRSEVVGKPVEAVINLREYGTDSPRVNPVYTALKENRVVDTIENAAHALLVGKDGRRVGVHVRAVPIPAEPGQAAAEPQSCLLVLYDASEALRLAERIAYLAQHDPLTGLPNRILLVDRLEQGTRLADRTSDHLAVVFLDLDHFHQVNETYGHALADSLLKEVAFRLTGALRESDTVCRLGGDEFVLLLRGVRSVSVVEGLAVKLQQEIGRPFVLGQNTVTISCSLGISLYPRDANDAETLMHLADGAMHKAKQSGRNQYLFARSEEPVTEDSEEAPLPQVQEK